MDELFPFVYVGGGYFRRRGVPKGTKAEVLHGKEAVEYLFAEMVKLTTMPPHSPQDD